MDDTTSSIIAAESGGNPNAQNPNSSASGPGQFIDSTWLETVKKHRPDIANLPDDQILALKNNPQLAGEMTAAYAKANQGILQQNGLPVTPGTTYLAHFAGPQGAVKVLQADPNASVEDVLGSKAVAANPFLKGMTAQGLQAWAAKKMGTPAPTAGPQNSTPQAPASPTQAIPPQQQPIFAQAPAPIQGAPAGMPASSVVPFLTPMKLAQAPLPQIPGLFSQLPIRG